MRALIFSLAALAIGAPALGAAERLPTFPKRELYQDARKSLLGLGWSPVRLEDADECRSDKCDAPPELRTCSVTGRALCFFTWRRRDTIIEVTTFGETTPMIDSVRCRVGCR